MEEITAYQAVDGKIFDNKTDCADYETSSVGKELYKETQTLWNYLASSTDYDTEMKQVIPTASLAIRAVIYQANSSAKALIRYLIWCEEHGIHQRERIGALNALYTNRLYDGEPNQLSKLMSRGNPGRDLKSGPYTDHQGGYIVLTARVFDDASRVLGDKDR